jgi:hypothetical protein
MLYSRAIESSGRFPAARICQHDRGRRGIGMLNICSIFDFASLVASIYCQGSKLGTHGNSRLSDSNDRGVKCGVPCR